MIGKMVERKERQAAPVPDNKPEVSDETLFKTMGSMVKVRKNK